jgi:hypothetical protein
MFSQATQPNNADVYSATSATASQSAGGGVDRKTIYYRDWNAERRLSEEVRHLRLGR